MQHVAIFGVPRSGTSWVGQIFNSSPHVAYRYQPVFAYSFEDSLSETSTPEDIQRFHNNLLKTDDDFVCQKVNVSGNRTPDFNKDEITHLVWKEVRYLNIIDNLLQQSSIQIIGMVRHPCGVLKSWMQAPKEFKAEWDIHEEWRHARKKNKGEHEFYGYERWLRATRMFLRLQDEYPDRFKTVVYESLLLEPESLTKDMFDFTDLPLTAQTRTFLAESTQTPSDDPYDVFRGSKSGSEWQGQLPPAIIDAVLQDPRFIELAGRFKWDKESA